MPQNPYFHLPKAVISEIRKQFAEANSSFTNSYIEDLSHGGSPENNLTGELSKTLSSEVKGNLGEYSWGIKRKHIFPLEENVIGADIFIVVELTEVTPGHAPIVKSKAVLVQAKRHSNKKKKQAKEQADNLLSTGIASTFAVYSEQGIIMIPTVEIRDTEGSWSKAKTKMTFESFFGDQILGCTAGTRDFGLDQMRLLLRKAPQRERDLNLVSQIVDAELVLLKIEKKAS